MTTGSRLRREIKQTRPFPSAAAEALLSLLKTADVVRSRVSRVIEPAGVTLQQYNVLRILRGAGPEGLPTLEIATRMVERTPGITRLLDRLEKKCLVRRERCPSDRRQVLCKITEAGLGILDALDSPVTRANSSALGDLSGRDQVELIRILEAIRGSETDPL